MLIHERKGTMAAEQDPRETFEAIGQGHLFAHWDARPPEMRRRLLEDLESLDPASSRPSRTGSSSRPRRARASSPRPT